MAKIYNTENRGKRLAYYRAYYRRKGIERRYGITYKGLRYLYEQQGGRCAICLRPYTWEEVVSADLNRKAALHIDHCHTTGRIRGLLCAACNKGVGHFGDNPLLLRSAVSYLETSA